MSFWEGSEWQLQQEALKAERKRRRVTVRRDNPSLSPADVDKVVEMQMREAHAPAPPKCCVCRRPDVAEYVRVGDYLGRCTCACHAAP